VVISASPWCIFPYNLMQDILIRSRVIDIFPKFKMAAAAILDFQCMRIWPFRRVGSVVFVFCTKFGSNICYSHWDQRTYAFNIHLMTSRELTSGFDFWSRGHLRVAVVHLSIQCMWIWPLRRVGSVVFVFCTKFGSNIYYSHWDQRTYASNIHLMTSRELTSGFDFWSRGPRRVAVLHLPI